MAKTEKKQTKTIVTYSCDVCGANADGSWSMTEWCNGDIVSEYWEPIDMCKKHSEIYSRLLIVSDNPFKFMKERYNGFSDECKQNLIEEIKNLEEKRND